MKDKKRKFVLKHKLPITYNCLSTSDMINYNCLKVNNFNKKCIKEYEEYENFNIKTCPKCESEVIIKWGTYTRNIIYYKKGKKYEDTIQIKRIKCKNCNKTQSIIPIFITPYKIHTPEYITQVIKEKITKPKTYNCIFEKYEISRQLLKYWLSCLEKHYTRITTTINETNKNKIIKQIKKTLYEFIYKYYKENKKIYMMYITEEKDMPILKWAPT